MFVFRVQLLLMDAVEWKKKALLKDSATAGAGKSLTTTPSPHSAVIVQYGLNPTNSSPLQKLLSLAESRTPLFRSGSSSNLNPPADGPIFFRLSLSLQVSHQLHPPSPPEPSLLNLPSC